MKGILQSLYGYLYRANLRSIVRRISSKDITLTSEADFIFRLDSALLLCREIDPTLIEKQGEFKRLNCQFKAPAPSIDKVIAEITDFRITITERDAINNNRFNETHITDLSKFFVSHSSTYLDIVSLWHELEKAIRRFEDEYIKLDDKILRSYYHRQGMRLADNLCYMLIKIANLLAE